MLTAPPEQGSFASPVRELLEAIPVPTDGPMASRCRRRRAARPSPGTTTVLRRQRHARRQVTRHRLRLAHDQGGVRLVRVHGAHELQVAGRRRSYLPGGRPRADEPRLTRISPWHYNLLRPPRLPGGPGVEPVGGRSALDAAKAQLGTAPMSGFYYARKFDQRNSWGWDTAPNPGCDRPHPA